MPLRLSPSAEMPTHSASRLLDMLSPAAAKCGDVSAELASCWAAVTVGDRLVASMQASNGLPRTCARSKAAHAVDRGVVEAFDCEMLGWR